MKNLTLCGLFLVLFSATQLNAGTTANTVKQNKVAVFTDYPHVTPTDPDLLRAATKAIVPTTITVYGSGGYDAATGTVCPLATSGICAIIETAFVDGTWGPDALVEETATAKHYFGVIESPIEDEDGNVLNFKFSSLTPIE